VFPSAQEPLSLGSTRDRLRAVWWAGLVRAGDLKCLSAALFRVFRVLNSTLCHHFELARWVTRQGAKWRKTFAELRNKAHVLLV
jgi:hypothetical protein